MPSEQLLTLGQVLGEHLRVLVGDGKSEPILKAFDFFRLPQDFGCFVDLGSRRFWLHLSETVVGPCGPEPSDPYAWLKAKPTDKPKTRRKAAGRAPKDEILI